MTEDRINAIMDMIRYEPLNVRQISTLTMISSLEVQKCIDKLVMEGIAEVSHTRKLKISTVTYYRLTNRVQRY